MKYYLIIHISFSWVYPKDVFKFLCSQNKIYYLEINYDRIYDELLGNLWCEN